MVGEHSHWDKPPHIRVVSDTEKVKTGFTGIKTSNTIGEKLQFICIDCGEIFRELKIKKKKK